MKLNIRSQLVLAFAAVLALVLISSAIVYWKASDVSQKLDRFKEIRIPLMVKSSAVELNLLKTRSDTRRVVLYVATGKLDKAKAYKQNVEQDWAAVNSEFEELPEMSKHFVLQENKDRVAKLETELPLLHQEQSDIVDRAPQRDRIRRRRFGAECRDTRRRCKRSHRGAFRKCQVAGCRRSR